MALLITCDTGGWKTPVRLKNRLPDSSSVATDRICDRSAFLATQSIGQLAGGDVICNEYRADLVDVGRSLHHRDLHPSWVRKLPAETRSVILDEIYRPYRKRVQQRIEQGLADSSYVVHLSVRTFDPRTKSNDWRRGDLGLLYDPAVDDEVDWCLDLIDELWETVPELKVRRNHPRRGTNDSLTKTLRSEFAGQAYLGIEVMINRAWITRKGSLRNQALAGLGQSIGNVCVDDGWDSLGVDAGGQDSLDQDSLDQDSRPNRIA